MRYNERIEPNFNGGLIDALHLFGGFRIVNTRAQMLAIPYLSRNLNSKESTIVYIRTDKAWYELVNNPVSDTTAITDWSRLSFTSSILKPVGNWDIDNTTPVLSDADAAGHDGEFYFVTNAPTPQTVTYAGLFQGQPKTLVDGDIVISFGTYWGTVNPTNTWDSLNKPQSITDYVNGIIIAHTHAMSDVIGLSAALSAKFDESNVADSTISFGTVPDDAIVDVRFLRAHYYTKDEVNDLLALGGGGSGSVTSFSAGTLSPLFTTSVATATTTPALSFALTNAAQNTVFAGPSSGGTGAPAYRAIVNGDITSLAFSKLTGTPTTRSGYGITDAQATLVSGTNIRTVNSTSLLGSGDIAITGPFSDAVALVKNAADTTKTAIFNASTISTGTARTYSLPDANGVLALLSDVWRVTGGTTLTGTTSIVGGNNILGFSVTGTNTNTYNLSPTGGFIFSTKVTASAHGTASLIMEPGFGFTFDTTDATSGAAIYKLQIFNDRFLVTDSQGTPTGIRYAAAGYVTSAQSLTDRDYVLGAKTFTAKQTFVTSTTGTAAINIPNGVTPTSPANGDIWGQGNHIFARLNGVTYQLDQQAAGSQAFSSLTAATGTNTVNNLDFAQEWQWDSYTGVTAGLTLSNSSTVQSSNGQALLRVDVDGANANSNIQSVAALFSVGKTGTGSTNVAGYFAASGGAVWNIGVWIAQGNLMLNPSTTAIVDLSNNEFFKFVSTASAVNEITLTNAATGGSPVFSATGGDTNIGITFSPKGTGKVVIDGVAIGRGGGSISSNTAIGSNALASNVSGTLDTAVGANSMINSTGTGNTAVGVSSLIAVTGDYNAGFGYGAGNSITTGNFNTMIGTNNATSGGVTTGSQNIFIGYQNSTNTGITTGSGNLVFGSGITGLSSSLANNIIFSTGLGTNIKLQFNGSHSWSTAEDFAFDSTTRGPLLKDTNGHYWRQTISTSGVVSTTDIGTSLP